MKNNAQSMPKAVDNNDKVLIVADALPLLRLAAKGLIAVETEDISRLATAQHTKNMKPLMMKNKAASGKRIRYHLLYYV